MEKEIILTKEKPLYIKSMTWHVVIKTELGKSSNWFKTKKEAEYFMNRMQNCTHSKYTKVA